MSFIKHHRNKVILLTIMVVVVLVCILASQELPTKEVFYTSESEIPIGEISDNTVVCQSFHANHDITKINLLAATYASTEAIGTLHASLKSADTNQILGNATYDMASIADNSFIALDFGKVLNTKGCDVVLELTASDTNEHKITFWASSTPEKGLYLAINGMEQLGNLVFSVSMYDSTIHCFSSALHFMLLIALAVSFYLKMYKDVPLHKIYLLTALLIGCVYMFAMTPMSIPDEPHHYHSGYEVSNMLMLQTDNIYQGASAHFDYSELVTHQNVSSAYHRLLNESIQILSPEQLNELIEIPAPKNTAYPIWYLPQAIGIALGRLLCLNFLGVFYLGRFMNLLFYVLCVSWAIKKTPKFKTTFFLIGILPMSLHQAASFSYDPFINGIAMLWIAQIAAFIFSKKQISKKDILLMLGLMFVLAPAKSIYSVLALMVMLIPAACYSSKKQRILVVCGVLGMCVFSIGIFNLQSILQVAHVESTPTWHGSENYSPSFIFKHPLDALTILITTLKQSGFSWLVYGVHGHSLSGLTLIVPEYLIVVFPVLLVGSGLKTSDETTTLSTEQRLWFGLTYAAVVLLSILSMFLVWTPNTSPVVLGVQARYFLPALPLAYMAMRNKTLVLTRNIDNYLITIGVFMHIPIIHHILTVTLAN